jgi:hypothetical protein
MPYFIFREHCCPVVNNINIIIIEWYKSYTNQYGVVPTSFYIDFKIRKKWKRDDVQWNTITLSIPVKDAYVQFIAMSSESFNQYYDDIKPEGDFHVHGTENYSNRRCAICLDRYGDKIRLENCNCLFHRECIETSVKYRKECPKCEKTINMSPK